MSYEIEHGILGKAYVMPLPPMIDETGSPYIPIYYFFPKGKADSIDEDSVLVRPFKKILKEGKQIGTITYIFYQERDRFYVLGALAATDKRVIFFPGMLDRRIILSPDGSKPLEEGKVLYADHYTLEHNWKTWHMSLLDKKIHGIKYQKRNTKKINNSLFLWFVLGIQSADKLEPMPKTQEIHLAGKNMADLQRRLKIMMESRENAVFPVIRVDDDGKDPYYLNFEFFVSKPELKNLEDFPEVIVHDLKNTTATIYDPRLDVITRIHTAFIKNFAGVIWIRVSKINGVLPYHAITASP